MQWFEPVTCNPGDLIHRASRPKWSGNLRGQYRLQCSLRFALLHRRSNRVRDGRSRPWSRCCCDRSACRPPRGSPRGPASVAQGRAMVRELCNATVQELRRVRCPREPGRGLGLARHAPVCSELHLRPDRGLDCPSSPPGGLQSCRCTAGEQAGTGSKVLEFQDVCGREVRS